MANFDEAVRFTNTVTLVWSKVTPLIPRSSLQQNSYDDYLIRMTDWRVWDAFHTVLPGTSANDDLALIGGTFATASPSIQTYDLKAAGAQTLYARILGRLSPEYVAGQAVMIRAHAGMLTTVADTTATIDFQVYQSDEEAGISADLCQTAAQSINSLTLADKDFTIDPSVLSPGNALDIRMALAINDGATATAVIGIVGAVKLRYHTRG